MVLTLDPNHLKKINVNLQKNSWGPEKPSSVFKLVPIREPLKPDRTSALDVKLFSENKYGKCDKLNPWIIPSKFLGHRTPKAWIHRVPKESSNIFFIFLTPIWIFPYFLSMYNYWNKNSFIFRYFNVHWNLRMNGILLRICTKNCSTIWHVWNVYILSIFKSYQIS